MCVCVGECGGGIPSPARLASFLGSTSLGTRLQPDVTIMNYKYPETQGHRPEGEGQF